MGLARKAGTEEMLAELAIEAGPGSGFRGRGGRGRGRFDPGEPCHMGIAAGAALSKIVHHKILKVPPKH